MPILALHGILFGRVAGSLEPRFRYLADVVAFVLFIVAAATTVVILQNPGATAFVEAWSLGRGILPGAAVVGCVLIVLGMTAHLVPVTPRIPAWTRTQRRIVNRAPARGLPSDPGRPPVRSRSGPGRP